MIYYSRQYRDQVLTDSQRFGNCRSIWICHRDDAHVRRGLATGEDTIQAPVRAINHWHFYITTCTLHYMPQSDQLVHIVAPRVSVLT
jgi:hypothetical protein